MARGDSGRIVLEVDPIVKKRLYQALDREGITLKDWFLKKTLEYVDAHYQLKLFDDTINLYK